MKHANVSVPPVQSLTQLSQQTVLCLLPISGQADAFSIHANDPNEAFCRRLVVKL